MTCVTRVTCVTFVTFFDVWDVADYCASLRRGCIKIKFFVMWQYSHPNFRNFVRLSKWWPSTIVVIQVNIEFFRFPRIREIFLNEHWTLISWLMNSTFRWCLPENHSSYRMNSNEFILEFIRIQGLNSSHPCLLDFAQRNAIHVRTSIPNIPPRIRVLRLR